MCGLLGIISKDLKSNNFKIEESMNVLSRRGPDYKKIWKNDEEDLLLGHARLSIIDLSVNAIQPMHSYDQTNVLIFNGCIYNFKELLINYKSQFKSNYIHSDTRLLTELINLLGINKTLNEIEGMYTFVYYDKNKRKINFVTDRFGEKPLYICFEDCYITFASDLNSLSILSNFNRELNDTSLNEYLLKGYIKAPLTIYKNIFKFKNSINYEIDLNLLNKKFSYKELTQDFLNQKKYWTINNREIVNYKKKDFIDISKKITDDYISKSIVSDVNVGLYYSGGKDSTYLLSKLANQNQKRIDAYSFIFEEQNYNSNLNSRDIEKKYNCNHHLITLNKKELAYDIEALPSIYGEPFADPSAIALNKLCKISRERIKVVLTGDGGDEIFGGYKRHFFYKKLLKINDNKIFTTILKILLKLDSKILNYFLKTLNFKYETRYLKSNLETVNSVFNQSYSDIDVYNKLVSKNIDTTFSILMSKSIFLDDVIRSFKGFMKREINDYLNGNILVKSDRACMFNGIENRSPFLNYKLVNHMYSLNDSLFEYHTSNKNLLDSFYKQNNFSFVNNKKSGFDVPISNWMQNIYHDYFLDLINSRNNYIFLSEYVNLESIKKSFEKFKTNYNQDYFLYWRLLNLLIWKNKTIT